MADYSGLISGITSLFGGGKTGTSGGTATSGESKPTDWGALIGGAASIAGQVMSNNSAADRARSTTQLASSETGSSSVTDTVTKGTDLTQAGLGEVIGQLLAKFSGGANPEFSKEQAIADSKDSAQMALNKVLEAGIPVGEARQMASGAYGSTTIDRMREDTTNRAQAAYGTVIQDSIARYAGLAQQEQDSTMKQLLGTIQLLQDANISSVKNAKQSASGSKATPTYQNQGGPGAGNTGLVSGLITNLAQSGFFNTNKPPVSAGNTMTTLPVGTYTPAEPDQVNGL
jgi:hypothetical protein